MQDELSLLKEIAVAEEAYSQRSYTIYRQNRPLTVTIFDQGPDGGAHRFMVTVEGERPGDHERSTGNSEATAEDALRAVNWWVFD